VNEVMQTAEPPGVVAATVEGAKRKRVGSPRSYFRYDSGPVAICDRLHYSSDLRLAGVWTPVFEMTCCFMFSAA